MSLRGVHILFILLSVLLSFGFAAYEWMAYQRSGGLVDCLIAVIAAVIGAGLAAYGVWFVRKPSRSKV
jgi:high-affinity K+ transport system ATPase subunit B